MEPRAHERAPEAGEVMSDLVQVTCFEGARILELPDDPRDWPVPPRWSDTGDLLTKEEWALECFKVGLTPKCTLLGGKP